MKKLGTPKAVRNFFAIVSGRSQGPHNTECRPCFESKYVFCSIKDGGNRRGEIGEFKEDVS